MIALKIGICALAFFGLYGLFYRLLVWLMPKKRYVLAVRAENLSEDSLCFLAELAWLKSETEQLVASERAVLFEKENDPRLEAVRRAGITVYVRK